MRLTALSVVVFMLALSQCAQTVEKPAPAPVKPVENEYWGITLTDPYQYMENLEDTLVKDWMVANADYARFILDKIPGRKDLVNKMREFDGRVSDRITNLTILDNDRYFYLKTTPEDETGKLFMREGYVGSETLLFDPQTYGEDSLDYVIGGSYPTFTGDKIAIEVFPNGSENTTTLILDVDQMDFFPEHISLSIGGISWLGDGNQFLYTKVNSEDVHDPGRYLNTRVFLHKLGTDQQDDQLFFSGEKYPSLGINPQDFPITIYDHYEDIILMAFVNVEANLILYFTRGEEVMKDRLEWKPLCTRSDEIQDFYIMDGDFYAYTAKNAPNFKVIRTSLTAPDYENAFTFIPEPEEGVLDDFSFTSTSCFYTLKINGTQTRLFKREEDGRSEIKLPVSAGTINMRTKGHRFEDIWVTLTGWTLNGERYRYLAGEGTFKEEALSEKAAYPEFADLVVEELMIPSHDGVEVPLSLIYKKDLMRDGTAPLLIYGYGSYGISDDPGFSPNWLLWCMDGGIFAVAHVRGGGALGEAWRLAGHKATKANTWKDLIAITEYLHEDLYSSPEHTAIIGGSAGGILVGRAMTDRPELYKAVLPLVGSMNSVREELTPGGPANISEFGTVEDSIEFLGLLEMDSYHHLKEGVEYPATLVTAGINDPRVTAWVPGKFAARLQAVNTSDNPILFHVDYKAGHGIGNTKTKNWEDMADYLSFAFWQTGHPKYQK